MIVALFRFACMTVIHIFFSITVQIEDAYIPTHSTLTSIHIYIYILCFYVFSMHAYLENGKNYFISSVEYEK